MQLLQLQLCIPPAGHVGRPTGSMTRLIAKAIITMLHPIPLLLAAFCVLIIMTTSAWAYTS